MSQQKYDRISQIIPEAQHLLELEPEVLGGYMLQVWNSQMPSQQDSFHLRDETEIMAREHYQEELDLCTRALLEAWNYLLRAGLVALTEEAGSFFVTKRGRTIRGGADMESFRKVSLFPRESVHPIIAETVYRLFLTGDYDIAVWKAFKCVEVEVRKACNWEADKLGVQLMRDAFHPKTGLLRNEGEPPAERQALSDLFAGAVGRFKNPSSHRHVDLTDPTETVEMIQLASHLLRVVDERARQLAQQSDE